jgi:deoxyribodipyrimidine photo-lyase
MHNRARLIVGNFMVKLMLIEWKKGEEYFSRNLIDIDIANNVGNWQWVAGNGADSQPYFRIFNPWIQSEKFDKDGNYIKKWIPELKNIPAKDLHQWNLNFQKYQINYPSPILDYKKQREKCLKLYKKYI